MADLQANQDALAQQQAMLAQQQAMEAQPAAAPAPAPGGMTDEKIAQLQKLGELKTAGILTEEEFQAEKAKILAS
jgi:multidrug resistance efflux pump